MGTQLPFPKKGAKPPPPFSAQVHCSQTAGWIKTALGVEAGLGPGHIVLDGGKPRPRRRCVRWGRSSALKGAQPPFSVHVYCGQTAGRMKTPWYGSRPRPRPHCVRRGPCMSPAKGAQQPAPLFGPCILWPRSPISATTEFLLLAGCLGNDRRCGHS